jgi:two-component system chemotaxis sensor kinase CheA
MSFSDQEIEEFKTEAVELLDVAEKSLLALDLGSSFKQTYDAVFRSFHNLKGAAGMMEMHRLQAHTHELESVLMPFKDLDGMPKNYISYFLNGIDASRSILEGNHVEFNYQGYVEQPASPAGVVQMSDEHKPVSEPVSDEPLIVPPADPVASLGASKSALAEFVAESEEVIVRVSKNLQVLEKGVASRDVIDELYRDIHSLKGTSYLFGFQQMGDIGHAMESAMEPVRDGTHSASRLLIDGLYKAIEALELDLECTKMEISNDQLKALAPTLIKVLGAAAKSLPLVTSNGESKPVAEAKLGQSSAEGPVVSVGATSVATSPVASSLAAVGSPAPAPVVAPVARVEELPHEPEHHASPAATAPASPIAAAPTSSGEAKDGDLGGSIRVPVALLDNLMTLMGEMVLVRNQVLQFSNNSEDLEFLNLSQRLNVVTSEIQGEMMKTRMQPIGNIMTKFHRVVRDLGQELKKSITFTLDGAETELDKSLLEAIKDPLTHIIRNSCDHGIETPEVRRKSGKSDGGKILVRSFHEGGQVVIEIADDGKGLNRDALIAKAVERGMMTAAQASQLSEKEVFNLIFAPGFSTAQKVTNVSGRGVGMDVVRTNIEKIGGTVDLNSQYGVGTTIRLKIPLTLAIVPALIVHSGESDGRFAIPQVKLVELVRVDQVTEQKIERLMGSPVFRLRGEILPLVDLNRVLGLSGIPLEEKKIFNIAVLNADNYYFGLIVDEIQDTADIVVKPLSRLLKSLHVYSGATILGDGSVALILDVLGLAKVAQIRNESAQAGASAAMSSIGQSASAAQSERQDFLLVRVGSVTKHALVLGYVHRLEEFKQSQIDVTGNHRVVRYRDAILPIVSANLQLGLPLKQYKPDEMISVVVVERGGHLYGIEVDEILDTLSTAADLDRSLNQSSCIIGNIATNNELIVAVDPFEMISVAFGQSVQQKSLNENVLAAHQGGASARTGAKEILLVEDTAFFRRIVKEVLEKAGYKVTAAVDGMEAAEILQKGGHEFSLILTDIEMPRMNGFELAKAVRANSKHKATPILALSSRFDQKYTAEAARVGIDHYLEKMKPEILLEAVSSLIQKRRAA